MATNPSTLYPGKINAPDANYPYGSARDVTTPGDGTGTPWKDTFVNDLWGFFQKLLNTAGITPSGNPDTILASQYFQALQATSGYPGLMVPLAHNSSNPPSTLGLRILICDGSLVEIATYPDLDSITYVGDGNNPTADSFYHTDIFGTRTTVSPVFFKLPDLRGRFLRGLDTAATRDEGGSGRLVGSNQSPAVSAHYHRVYSENGSARPMYGWDSSAAVGGATTLASTSVDTDEIIARDITSGNNTNLDNRPYNMAINWGIWY